MYESRFSLPDSLVLALGRATANFAMLEWQVVAIIAKLDPTAYGMLEKKTAGWIAKRLRQVTAAIAIADATLRVSMDELVDDFDDLVDRRNKLMHAHWASSPPFLQFWSPTEVHDWTESAIWDLAREFEEASIRGNAIHYDSALPDNRIAPPIPQSFRDHSIRGDE